MNKQRELNKIADEIAKCRICKIDSLGMAVPGEGSPNADIVFIGEAPGKQEAKTGRPFIGPSGKFLRRLIVDAGLNENDIFIASPVKYLPKRGTPTLDQIAHGKTHFLKQLAIIKPKVLVLLGRVACLAMLSKSCSIASDHGKIIKLGPYKHFISYHPAAALHDPRVRPMIVEDFKKLKKFLRMS